MAGRAPIPRESNALSERSESKGFSWPNTGIAVPSLAIF